MREILEVSSDWLALREPEDARARSRQIAAAAANLLAAGPVVVHDLGSGTGSMMRWLAPILPGPQKWVLHDWNPRLVEHAVEGPTPGDRDSRPVSIEVRTGDLAQFSAADLEGASLVTASALLDVLTSREVDAVVRACVGSRVPALLTLSVTGRVELTPHADSDEEFGTAFNSHQRRDDGGRRMLGQYAPMIARGLFLEAGWRIKTTDTVWALSGTHPQLLREWWDGWVDAACEQQPGLRLDHADYLDRRRSELDQGLLTGVVHHTDLLAWPS